MIIDITISPTGENSYMFRIFPLGPKNNESMYVLTLIFFMFVLLKN